ncbi:MAG: MBL fold metallo-hydrolase [Clostridiales bacterium]|nr:MBL fold metallo-hydrolase [Clostridiales bacterium]
MNRQAIPPKSIPMSTSAFQQSTGSTLHWLGSAGLFLNSRGTCIMIDPMLEGFDLPLLIDLPIHSADIPHLDGLLVTHSDNDHFSRETCRLLAKKCSAFHSTQYVHTLMQEMDLPSFGHDINNSFAVDNVQIKLTPAYHTWQNEFGGFDRIFLPEDACGYYITTPDGTVFAPGDSRLLSEQLELPAPDVILFDFSDDPWHIGLDGAEKLAAAYPNALLMLSHWGTVDAPDMLPFNADPHVLYDRIVHPERIRLLAPGQALQLCS